MSGIIALSINKDVYSSRSIEIVDRKFTDDLFWNVSYHQHLIKKYGGMATLSGKGNGDILVKTHGGVFRDTFQDDLDGYRGPVGLGHIGGFREPYLISRSRFSTFAICFAGNIINSNEIVEDFLDKGYGLERNDDVVLISQLLTQAGWDDNKSKSENFIAAFSNVAEQIHGAFALAVLVGKSIYVARGPDGHEGLTIGKKKGAVAVASESCCFYNQGFETVRDLEPGEVVLLKNGIAETKGYIKTKKTITSQSCAFCPVYTSDPATVNNGLSAKEVRIRLGSCLAKKDIEDGFIPYVIIPVPDSGRFHAIGYLHEFIRQMNNGNIARIPLYDESLIKYSYAGRSYTPDDEDLRKLEAIKKLIPIIEKKYREKNVVVVDDSIVRGTQTRSNLVPKLEIVGFSKIHMRISWPKLVSSCPWGKSNKEKRGQAAVNSETGETRTEEEIAELLGVESCKFNLISDVSNALEIPEENLCFDCARRAIAS
ncbi:MAG: hypothetical protein ABIG10_01360 [bacterium]